MLTKRIIPCLDIRDGRVVKGVNFVDIRDAGDPVEAAVRYNEAGADELVLLDINASYEKRGTMLDVVSRVAEQVFIPFTVGGGISDIDQTSSPTPSSAASAGSFTSRRKKASERRISSGRAPAGTPARCNAARAAA